MIHRRTALHFLLLGGLLFGIRSALGPPGVAVPEFTVESASPDEVLLRSALTFGLDRDDPVVQRRVIQNMRFVAAGPSSDAALYRDGVALGLAETDLVVRRRLIDRMRRLLEAPGLAAAATDAELQGYLDAHAEQFAAPARVRLTQIALSGAADALPVPAELPSASEWDVARWLGPEFAAAVFALPVGEWHGPIASPYGQHLVWIHERRPAERPALDEVRTAVRAAIREERAAAAVQEALERTQRSRGYAEVSQRGP